MSPDERTEAEARADRALRRGELSTALTLFQAIAAAFPGDDVVQQKLRTIRANLQPMELTSAKTRVPIDQSPPPTNSIQSAEALAAVGDYAGAIALYRKALEKRPDSPLIRERLAELFQIVQSMAPRPSPQVASATAPMTASAQRAPAPAAETPRPAGEQTPGIPRQPGNQATGVPRPPGNLVTQVPRQPGNLVTPPQEAQSQAPVSTARLLSDLLDQISRRRRTPTQMG